jgi:hypothetical protein
MKRVELLIASRHDIYLNLNKVIDEVEKLGKGMAQMFWGAIWVGGRSELILMERGEGAARHGYSSLSYETTHEEGILPDWDEDIDLFMQVNAPIHKSGSTPRYCRSCSEDIEGNKVSDGKGSLFRHGFCFIELEDTYTVSGHLLTETYCKQMTPDHE